MKQETINLLIKKRNTLVYTKEFAESKTKLSKDNGNPNAIACLSEFEGVLVKAEQEIELVTRCIDWLKTL